LGGLRLRVAVRDPKGRRQATRKQDGNDLHIQRSAARVENEPTAPNHSKSLGPPMQA
jgi:hypothetical protein